MGSDLFVGYVFTLTLSRLKVKYNKTARPDTAAPSNAPRTVAEIIDKTHIHTQRSFSFNGLFIIYV